MILELKKSIDIDKLEYEENKNAIVKTIKQKCGLPKNKVNTYKMKFE